MMKKITIPYLIQRFHFLLEFVKENARKNRLCSFLVKLVVPRLINYQYPVNYNIETTNACNLNCQMCPRRDSGRQVGFMSMDLFKKIVDEAKGHGPIGFSLHKDGEPLMHPNLFSMADYIKKSDPRNIIYLTTNGILLDERISQKLLELGLDRLNISIGAARRETFKKIKGFDGLERVEENVRRFIEMKERGGCKTQVIVQIIKMEETLDEIEEFRAKWSRYPVTVDVWNFLNWGGARYDRAGESPYPKKRYPCYALWFSPAINWSGLVSLCCMDWDEKLIIGDVKNQTLAEIWQGEELKRYRTLHLRGEYDKIPVCDRCNYWSWWPDIFFKHG